MWVISFLFDKLALFDIDIINRLKTYHIILTCRWRRDDDVDAAHPNVI